MAKSLYGLTRSCDGNHPEEFDSFMETIAPEQRMNTLHVIFGRLQGLKCQIQHHEPPHSLDQQGQYRIDDIYNAKLITRDARYVLKENEIEELKTGLKHLRLVMDARNSRNNLITAARRNSLKSWRRLSSGHSEEEVYNAVKDLYTELYERFYEEYDRPAKPHYVLKTDNKIYSKDRE